MCVGLFIMSRGSIPMCFVRMWVSEWVCMWDKIKKKKKNPTISRENQHNRVCASIIFLLYCFTFSNINLIWNIRVRPFSIPSFSLSRPSSLSIVLVYRSKLQSDVTTYENAFVATATQTCHMGLVNLRSFTILIYD